MEKLETFNWMKVLFFLIIYLVLHINVILEFCYIISVRIVYTL